MRPLSVLAVILAVLPATTAASENQELRQEESVAETSVTDQESEAPDDSISVSEQSVLQETITVTATRGPRGVNEVPATVTVISSDEIESRLMQHSGDLARYEPGIYAQGSPGRTGVSGLNIRGIGGNRVLTQIDGIPTAEEFEFGHFEVPQYALDVETLRSVEILRGAASSLYGSDALGGVVSYATKDPGDYLGSVSTPLYLGLRTAWDGRNDQLSTSATAAFGRDKWQSSLLFAHRDGAATSTRGVLDTKNSTRTVADPQDWTSNNLLAKFVYSASPSNSLKTAFEWLGREVDTEVLSLQGTTDLGAIFGFPPFVTWKVDKPSFRAHDTQDRMRLSLEQDLVGRLGDHLLWRAHALSSHSQQDQQEVRTTVQGGGPFGQIRETNILRQGLITFEQDTWGAEVQGSKGIASDTQTTLLTYGVATKRDRFDQIRDRTEIDIDSGLEVATDDGLHFPTKYFPASTVDTLAAYVQGEIELLSGRLVLVPGLRWDDYRLDADTTDPIYLSGNVGTLPPVDIHDSALSPKLGITGALGRNHLLYANFAQGFRAPPFSAVNNGFTHLAGGLTRLPNPDLRPETSNGYEIGLRGSYRTGGFQVTGFHNDYEDFIELIVIGLNPATGLIEFQQQNITAATISGIEIGGDFRPNPRWGLRAALALIEGENRTESVPLNSIPPRQLVAGIRRGADSGRWSIELVGSFTAAKNADEVDSSAASQFLPPAYQLIDLFGTFDFSRRVSVTAGIFNILDQRYWAWNNVIGITEESPVLDRFSGPGISASAALRLRW